MASTKTIFGTAFRWATWPLIVIVALNIENRATEAGYSRISLRALFGSDMSSLYWVLTSDFVWGSALFLAGAITFSWLDFWIETSDQKQGWLGRWGLTSEIEVMTKALEGPGFSRNMMNPRRRTPFLNKKLIAFGLDPIPDFAPDNEDQNKRSARYLRAIYGPLKLGDLTQAREVGQAALKLEKAKANRARRP